jgi:anti-sigma regulatory factor (Ser/Thr protein kinase)
VVCEDSGQGFDFENYSEKVSEQRLPPGTRYAGRGLELLRRMTRQLRVHGRGNHVEIIYDWESTELAEKAPSGHNDTQRTADD